MKTYTGYEYLCIDIANQFGLDKELFGTRIDWVQNNLHQLESLASKAENQPLYTKAVMALRKAQQGLPSGHMVALDACNSGMQIMSTITGCVVGATNTGLVDPDKRSDAYGELKTTMESILGGDVPVNRKSSKDALMTMFYGSKAKPIEIFGEDTPELHAFYKAAQAIAPGAWECLQDLLGSWQSYAKVHAWKLPDGFDARVKVMDKQEVRIEVDELDHASFTYEFYENKGTKKGLANAANVIHSIDAYVLRCTHRRCNYDAEMVRNAHEAIHSEILAREQSMGHQSIKPVEDKLQYYIDQYNRSGMADAAILPYVQDGYTTMYMDIDHLKALLKITYSMLVHKPFPLVTIHDAFAAHPNNLNHVRQHYINIFAELADSRILEDILSQIHQCKGKVKKLSDNLSTLIRGSEYALS